MIDKNKRALLIGALSAAVIIIINDHTPAGFAVWIALIPILALLAKDLTVKQVGWMAALFTAVIISGYWTRPRTLPMPMGLTNRVLGSAALLMLAWMAVKHKRADATMHEMDENYRSLVETSPYGAYILQGDRLVYANRSLCDITGYNCGELFEKNVLDLAHPDDRAYAEEILGKVKSGEAKEVHVEIRGIRKNGEIFWADIAGNAGFYKGRPAFLGKVFDITERKRAEGELRESRRLLQDIIDSSPVIIFIKDTGGRFITINKLLEDLLGMTREEIKGKTDYDIFPREMADHYTANDRLVMQTKEPIQTEEVADLANGRRHIFLASKFPLVDEYGNVYGVCGISHDITERKELERARVDFVSMLTHDLRSPLTAILGYSELLLSLRRELGPNKTEMVEGIDRSAERMMRLVEDFLTVSRLEAGRMQLALAPESVQHLLGRVAKDFMPAAEKKGISLETDLSEVPLTCVDLKHMERSVSNLLQNAIDYTPSGGRVTLKAESGNRGDGRRHGAYLAISVIDTGPGIPEEDRDKIFNRYFTTPKSGKKGTGLGLAIVKAVAEAHGGRATVYSEPGKGSDFRIYLPVRTDCKLHP